MRRTLPSIALLIGLLACSPSAFAQQAGHNKPTRMLEGAFKIAQRDRAGSPDGCYQRPKQMASSIRNSTKLKTGVARNLKGVRRAGVVYVLKRKARCGHVTLALRFKKSLWALDSTKGTVGVVGKGGGNNTRDEAKGGRGPLRSIKIYKKALGLSRVDTTRRGIVRCKGKRYPLGGGMFANPVPTPDGEGVFPHSYERLGAQRGWHVNPVLIDREVLAKSLATTRSTPRRIVLQVVCGRGLVATSGPRKTKFLRPGQSATVVARCPKGQRLFSGGFQRTNFKTPGGSYVTESRAKGKRAWKVRGRGHGRYGGELTAIAYCTREKQRLRQVSRSTTVPANGFARATTPKCPKGWRLTSGGFSTGASQQAFIADGFLNKNGTWSSSAFGYFGPAPVFTAFGYCLKPGR